MVGGQYGESKILDHIFKDQEQGLLIDVGAADGIDNSNSYFLLKRKGWRGILIEPELTQYQSLVRLYKDDTERVTCLNIAIGNPNDNALLYCSAQASTFIRDWRTRCEVAFGSVYYAECYVKMRELSEVCNAHVGGNEIDFLSIDCEGMDLEVLRSLDMNTWRPRIICIEAFDISLSGYEEFCRTRGNTFYARTD